MVFIPLVACIINTKVVFGNYFFIGYHKVINLINEEYRLSACSLTIHKKSNRVICKGLRVTKNLIAS